LINNTENDNLEGLSKEYKYPKLQTIMTNANYSACKGRLLRDIEVNETPVYVEGYVQIFEIKNLARQNASINITKDARCLG
jgi:hypothetical protein